MGNDRGAILVTGASSGLGAATARWLADAGFAVYAGVRSAESAERIARENAAIRPLILDVTSAGSIGEARAFLAEQTGGDLHGLVNNAGICVSAPLECVPLDDLRAELEVNLVGTVAVTQAFLPLLRRRGPSAGGARPAGRIVTISSGIGRVAAPFLGAYAASQFAKEGVSGALRRELAPLAVSVSIIEPGAIMTPIWPKLAAAAAQMLDRTPAELADPYRERFGAFLALNERRARESKTSPVAVARAVGHAMTARRPRIRYHVGMDALATALAARLVPDRLLDAAIHRQFDATGTVVAPAAEPKAVG